MAVVKTNPVKIPGPWVDGRVLDRHTISSTWTGDSYHFDTTRTELGELVYRLKYGSATEVLPDIIDTAEAFVRAWKIKIDCVVPAPPSVNRRQQPVVEIAKQLAARLGVPCYDDALAKVTATRQMKDVREWAEREKLLEQAVQAGASGVGGKSVLLVDDLIQSGSTLRRATNVLMGDAGAARVYALALTRTRR